MRNMFRNLVVVSLVMIANTVVAGKLKGKIATSGDNGMISIGGGVNLGTSSVRFFDGLTRFDANVYMPVLVKDAFNVGLNFGGEYNSTNKDPKLPSPFNVSGQTSSTVSYQGTKNPNTSGFKLEAGPQLNFTIGNNFIISPIFSVGFTAVSNPNGYSAIQTTMVNGISSTYFLATIKQSSGLNLTPKIRVNYMINKTVGFWAESGYMMVSNVNTDITRLKPEGVADKEGNYLARQLELGTIKFETSSGSYNAFGIKAGITIALGGENLARKGWDGSVKGGKKTTEEASGDYFNSKISGGGGGAVAASYASTGMVVSDGKDDDCDGLTYRKIDAEHIVIKGIDVNGIPFEHAINTKGTGAINGKMANVKSNPLYENNKNEGENPLFDAERTATSNCGSVSHKITYPDGITEEFTFACPADAANYHLRTAGNMPNRISMNVTVPKQTQSATFGEKVNQGLHAAGGALSQGASLLGGALPGGAVISAVKVAETGNSTEQPSSISNVLKTKHDTVKNSVGNIRRAIAPSDSITTNRKGWDGTVKGSAK
jgi:hypothetical protein